MAGRVTRFPFDDEIFTLSVVERYPILRILTTYPGGIDVHPPLAYVLFYTLHHLGLSPSAMRFFSVAMTAVALGLFHLIALALLERRDGEPVALSTRLVGILLFGMSPLAIGQGDALRWYPLFAMLCSAFVAVYLLGTSIKGRLWSAVPLGLAASTNFVAVAIFVPWALYRYGMQRQFRTSFEFTFALIAVLFAGFGISLAYSIVLTQVGDVSLGQFDRDITQAVVLNLLGFFGGYGLGISQSWIIVPVVIISIIATILEIDRKHPANPINLLVLMTSAAVLMTLFGFSKPRSFLYLSPVVALILMLWLGRQVRQGNRCLALLCTVLILAPSVAAIANLNSSTHPYKRNLAIPYEIIVDFIQNNEAGSALIISTEPVIPWMLRRQPDSRCVSYFLQTSECFDGREYNSIIFVNAGHTDRSEDRIFMRTFETEIKKLVAARRKVATIHAGIDDDAAFKSRWSGAALSRNIVEVDLYR